MLRFVVLAVFVAAAAASDFKPLSAIVRITSDKVPSNVQGNITFRQINPNEVQVEGTIIGMSPGLYGFHVHEKGDLTNGCLSAGAHFNPYQKTHGAPDAGVRHVGDLGNVEFGSDLIARINFVDRQLSLQGERSILGRAVVLHSGKDDLGLTNHPDSLTTGNAGGRAACGVIGILDPVAWNSATSRSVSVMAIVSSAVLALAFAY